MHAMTYGGVLLRPLGLRASRRRRRRLLAADGRERQQLLRRPAVQVRLRDGVGSPLQSRKALDHLNPFDFFCSCICSSFSALII